MGSIPLPALDVRPPQQPNPLEQMGQLVQLRQLLQAGPIQQQMREEQLHAAQLQNQQAQYGIEQTKAVNQGYKDAFDPSTQQLDQQKLTQSLAQAGHGSAVPDILKHYNDFASSQVELQKKMTDLQTANQDSMGSLGAALKSANYDPNLGLTILQDRINQPNLPPQMKQQLAGFQQRLQQADPATAKGMIQQVADNWIAQSPKQRELGAQELNAAARWKGANKPQEGELPLGDDRTQQLNQLLTQRFQVLNPGKTPPAAMQLQAGATQKDFDRIDRMMEGTERAQGTVAQFQASNALRQQAAVLAQSAAQERQQAAEDRHATVGLQPVIGQDAEGNEVLVSKAEADKIGLSGQTKADADAVNKATAARHWLQLATKKAPDGAPAGDKGIQQLIDEMDAKGKLGPLAGRWNDFMSGKFGAGDPDYTALRAKMGLSTTKLMQAHVGSRGGAFMMEHFEDLANAGKMDAANLKSAVNSEVNYMKDVAMLPKSRQQQSQQPVQTQPAPQTHSWSASAWQKSHPGQDVNAAKAYAQQQGYKVLP